MTAFTYVPLIPNDTNSAADINTPLTDAKTVVNGNLDTNNFSPGAGIVGTQLSSSAAITTTQLASPDIGPQTTIIRGMASAATMTAFYHNYTTSGTWLLSGSTTTGLPPLTWRYRTADFAVTGHSPVFRLRSLAVFGSTALADPSLVVAMSALSVSSGNYTGGDPKLAFSVVPATANSITTNSNTVAASDLTDGQVYCFQAEAFANGGSMAGISLGFDLSVSYT